MQDGGVTATLEDRKRRGVTRAPVYEHADADELMREGADLVQRCYKSKATRVKYDRIMREVKDWVANAPACAAFRDGLKNLSERSADLVYVYLLDFKRRGKTYVNYMAHHSALVEYFEMVHGCSRDPQAGWYKDRANGRFVGNPAYAPRYKQALRSYRNEKAKEQGSRDHAAPMLYKDLGPLLQCIDTQLEVLGGKTGHEVTKERTTYEMMRCFAIVAYRLWARCDELCNMTWDGLGWEPQSHPDGSTYTTARLTFRKTNQLDAYSGKDYRLYTSPGRPLVDTVTAVPRWRQYWELVSPHPPSDTDLVFPLIGKTGLLDMRRKNDCRTMLRALRTCSELLPQGRTRLQFTMHSFRRGGCQDETTYAGEYGDPIITHEQAMWWGGWCDDELGDSTILKYMFNTQRYLEKWHGDMRRPGGRHAHWLTARPLRGASDASSSRNDLDSGTSMEGPEGLMDGLNKRMDHFAQQQNTALERLRMQVHAHRQEAYHRASLMSREWGASMAGCPQFTPYHGFGLYPVTPPMALHPGMDPYLAWQLSLPQAQPYIPHHDPYSIPNRPYTDPGQGQFNGSSASHCAMADRLTAPAEQTSAPTPQPRPLAGPGVLTDIQGAELTRIIPRISTPEQAVQQWEHTDRQRNHPPVKDWVRIGWITKTKVRGPSSSGNYMTWLNRKHLFDAFVKHGRSWSAFYAAYGGPGLTLNTYRERIAQEKGEEERGRRAVRAAQAAELRALRRRAARVKH
ncbi:unnamed protein product [Parajaminaea phylloscopi]